MEKEGFKRKIPPIFLTNSFIIRDLCQPRHKFRCRFLFRCVQGLFDSGREIVTLRVMRTQEPRRVLLVHYLQNNMMNSI
jgi:hypothetical protein